MKSLAEIMDALPADFPYRHLMPRHEVAAPREPCDNTTGSGARGGSVSEAEETLRREIHETKQNAQETWLHVRCSKMLDALGALKAAHAEALKAARAEGFVLARGQAAEYAARNGWPTIEKHIRAMKDEQ